MAKCAQCGRDRPLIRDYGICVQCYLKPVHRALNKRKRERQRERRIKDAKRGKKKKV